ncbi:hypothetical protein SLEP1_g18728 [Rubroshorea leprosula]|uniref:Uncharacterized protein n=1 Tax=Rubroshorea leprosula TaxID=152421 RepID=A0AAV5J956_9ROSI|nr:hypothetical protein SLEP1_g18728 [Rubroshorea leprosula]
MPLDGASSLTCYIVELQKGTFHQITKSWLNLQVEDQKSLALRRNFHGQADVFEQDKFPCSGWSVHDWGKNSTAKAKYPCSRTKSPSKDEIFVVGHQILGVEQNHHVWNAENTHTDAVAEGQLAMVAVNNSLERSRRPMRGFASGQKLLQNGNCCYFIVRIRTKDSSW